ncbi:MAG TPA: transcription repressor NadR [Oscillospiraceae bacterium]|nr:transcription repressor NadR [Oscillospiraceae bacterium]
MDAAARRRALLEELSDVPVPATALAARFGVSRQVIVGDIALLRAGGESIFATPRGYVTVRAPENGILRTVACRHGAGDMEEELLLMVAAGAGVLDVIVEHPVYGQLTGELGLFSRRDVMDFVRRADGMRPLSQLTGGIHLHTLRCPDEETFLRAQEALRAHGYLLED